MTRNIFIGDQPSNKEVGISDYLYFNTWVIFNYNLTSVAKIGTLMKMQRVSSQ